MRNQSFVRYLKREAMKIGCVKFSDRLRVAVRKGEPVKFVHYKRDRKELIATSK